MNVPVNHPLPILDLDVLRTFVMIADTGSFSAAANAVFRTPSAVSMQIKKLEELLGATVFERDARSVRLTRDGETLLGYARRMLALNREAVSRFITPSIFGVVRLGSPDDIGEYVLPSVLKRFAETHPRVVVDVVIDQSANLRKRFEERTLDLTLINLAENVLPDAKYSAAAEILFSEQLVWAGARCGTAYQRDPLPLSMWEEGCAWRSSALARLDKAGKPYRIAYMSSHSTGQKAAIQSDLAVAPFARSLLGDGLMVLDETHGLPALGQYHLGMLVADDAGAHILAVSEQLRALFDNYRKTGHFDILSPCC